MIRMAVILVLLSMLALHPERTHGAENPKKDYEVESFKDISYVTGQDADPIKHKLDIYKPKGQKDFPVMLFVHGGSWSYGNKGMYAAVGDTFAKLGIGTVIINYRLTNKENHVKHPDHVRDVAAAFAWVHANIERYGGRRDRIFLSGHSAGAHLVALLATDESYLKAHQLGFENIRGVMALSGVYEIVPMIPIFFGPFGTDADAYKGASPINHVKANDPPFLICYGDKDYPLCDKISEAFCKKLKLAHCEARTQMIKDRNHFSIIIQLALSPDDPCTKAMLDFIAEHSEWKRPG